MSSTSTPRALARTRASTIPEPVVSPYAPTRIWRSALSIARTANAAQSSSGEKQMAIAASETTVDTGSAGAAAARASERATENTQKLYSMKANSLLPCHRLLAQINRAVLEQEGRELRGLFG